MNEEANRPLIAGVAFGGLIAAALWPLIFPGLEWLLAFAGFSESPGLIKAVTEFGPLYGRLSSTAPGFFKGMAEASDQISGDNPAIAGLSYLAKSRLLAYATTPIYFLEIITLVLAGGVALSSRLFGFWKPARTTMEILAIILAGLPLVAVSLWSLFFIALAYIQAWPGGILHFGFLLLLFPAVAAHVISPSIGVFLLARFTVPVGLVFGRRDGLAVKVAATLQQAD
jgi:hypothetical protein